MGCPFSNNFNLAGWGICSHYVALMSPSFSFEAKKPQPRPQEDLIYSKRRKVIVDNPGNHPDPLIRDCNKPQALAFTTSTMPSQPSTQLSSEKVEPVNKQPPPAPRMSTDSDANELPVGQRAMRLRGGCLVRHSNAVSIPITYTFSRNWIGLSVGSAIVNFVFEEENQEITDATCNEAQVRFVFCSTIPITYTYSRVMTASIPCCC